MSVNWNKHTLREVTYHTKTCTDVRWNCDGSYLGSSSYDKTVKIGQLSPDGGVKTVQTVQCAQLIQSVSWHPSEPQRFVIAGDDKSIEVWDVRASRASTKMASLGNNINVVWSPDGRYLAVGNSQDKLAVIDVHASKIVKKANFGYEVNELAWTANSDHLLVANAFGEMGNVDVISFHNEDLTLIDTITAHTSNSYCLKVRVFSTSCAIHTHTSRTSHAHHTHHITHTHTSHTNTFKGGLAIPAHGHRLC